MNDVHDFGGGNGGRSSESDLQELAKELQRAATDAYVHDDTKSMVVDNSAEAFELATSLAELKSLEVIERPDGRIDVGESITDEWYDTSYWPRDSQAWLSAYKHFEWLKDRVTEFCHYDSEAFTTAIHGMDNMINQLGQGGLTMSPDEISDQVNQAANGGENVNLSGIFEPESEWVDINEVSKAMTGWDGIAADIFRLGYADRLPVILVGQQAIAMALREALSVAQAAFRGAQEDAMALTQANIDVLDCGAEMDVNWSEVMKTVSEVSLIVTKAASFVPLPGVATFSTVATYVGNGASLAHTALDALGYTETSPKLEIGYGSYTEILGVFNSEAEKIDITVQGIEEAAANVLAEFHATATSTSPGARLHPSWDDPIDITIREAFFEPKEPGSLISVGDTLADSNPTNDPTYTTLRDTDLMGSAPHTGAQVAANLVKLYRAGDDILPRLADRYSHLVDSLGIGTDGLETAFMRPDGTVAGGSQNASGVGVLYPAWVQLHDELSSILRGSSTNLGMVALALMFTAEAYTASDEAAEAEIRSAMDGELPWE